MPNTPTRSISVASIAPGHVIQFSPTCPLPQLAGQKLSVTTIRSYLFGNDITLNYELSHPQGGSFFLTIAEDSQGYYLAVSRLLSAAEQDQFFGRDALSFFTEPSSAKTIRCKADLLKEGAWMGAKYIKNVDWIEGALAQGRVQQNQSLRSGDVFHYNLLVDETGEHALEIECYDAHPEQTKIYITTYRPIEDISTISEPVPFIPAPQSAATPKARPVATTPQGPTKANGVHPPETKSEPSRPDFRRLAEDGSPIRVARAQVTDVPQIPKDSGTLPPLPSFLMSREQREPNYLSLDDILTPETERVRIELVAAKVLIDTAFKRRVAVREVLRELLGLDTAINDDVLFEMPLTEQDYRELAQRYKLKPDRRADIRTCLQEELRLKLLSIVKQG